ncbi:uncharacterized protein LOC127877742 isoform X1 [Dreissena polymorpha]|uniref:uncharacterized protein LOC127877742 isoform X1 n=2 Tax=Dreissena polymorpha TaxID=45954 RepID=UPI00226420CB|nr:uncharacterized protein LOC127877742 isoform X1 [Dreissena polymorpha]
MEFSLNRRSFCWHTMMGDESSVGKSPRNKKRAANDDGNELHRMVRRLHKKIDKLTEKVDSIQKQCIVIQPSDVRNHSSEKKGLADQCPVCGNHQDILKVGIQQVLKTVRNVTVDRDTEENDVETSEDSSSDDDDNEEEEEVEEGYDDDGDFETPASKREVSIMRVDVADNGHINLHSTPSKELADSHSNIQESNTQSEGLPLGINTADVGAKSGKGKPFEKEDITRHKEDGTATPTPRKLDASTAETSTTNESERSVTEGHTTNNRTKPTALNFTIVSSSRTDAPDATESSSDKRPMPYKFLRKLTTTFEEDNRHGYNYRYVLSDKQDKGKTYGIASSSKPNVSPKSQPPTASPLRKYHGSVDNRLSQDTREVPNHGSISFSNRDLVLNGPRKIEKPFDEPSKPFESDTNDGMVTDAFLSSLLQTCAESAECCGDVKSQGTDTAICLDLSGSMEGEPLQEAKDAILRLLDGIEKNSIEHELEENVSLVTFGKKNAVLQHLTNNYDLIRNQLDNLTTGETSPLWLGLALCLTELTKRGGNLRLNHVTVRPRIIVISDGFVTEKQKLYGKDVMNSNDMANREIQELHDLLVSKWDVLHGIDCLLVNPSSCQDILAKVSNNRVFNVEHVDYLVEHFRVQMALDTYIENIKAGRQSHDQAKEELQNTDFHPLSKVEMSTNIDNFKPKEQEKAHTLREHERSKTQTEQASVDDVKTQEHMKTTKEKQSDGNFTEKNRMGSQSVKTEGTEVHNNHEMLNSARDLTRNVAEGSQTHEHQAKASDDSKTENGAKSRSTRSKVLKLREEPIQEENIPLNHAGSEETEVDKASVEDEIDEVAELDFATPVKANPNWEEARKRLNQIGKVIGKRQNGYLPIIWENGDEEKCRYGVSGQYDVKPTEEKYVDHSIMKIGAVVERGPDWKWKDQDGGPGNPGVVTKIDGSVVYVLWIHGVRGNYSYGYRNKYHVKLVEKVKGSYFCFISQGQSNVSNFSYVHHNNKL